MRTLRKFVRTPSSLHGNVTRYALVKDVERFQSTHPTGWKEVDMDLDDERRRAGFNVVFAEARKRGFAVIQR
jgi:hypothetical protein